MDKLQVATETFGENALFPRRTIRIGSKTVQTPTKAIPTDKTREHEPVASESRGVNELYLTVDKDRLLREQRGTSTAIVSQLRRGLKKTQPDELTFAFASYEEASTLEEHDAKFLVGILDDASDVLTVPLIPNLAKNVNPENGVQDGSYRSYKRSILRYLEKAREFAPSTPIMGTIPPLAWEFIDDLMEVYAAHEVEAYCLNFNRRRITASRQVGMLKPLMQNLVGRGLEDEVLLYGINMNPGQRDASVGARPATDIVAAGMGIDIIGDNHVPPNLPQEVFERMEEQQTEEGEGLAFRLFDKEDYVRRDIPLDQLPDVFPADSALSGHHVASRVQASPTNAKYRLQSIVNAEQMAIATRELQEKITTGNAYPHMVSKVGVVSDSTSACQSVREGFDEGHQSSLSGF
jgi:hypothetical protein